MLVRPYEKLIAWQEAHKLVLSIHSLLKKFPSDERFRLVDQMCRASYSIPMNLAEGNGKKSLKERARYFEVAACSLDEIHYQSRLARDLQFITQEDFSHTMKHIHRLSYLLYQLRESIRKRPPCLR